MPPDGDRPDDIKCQCDSVVCRYVSVQATFRSGRFTHRYPAFTWSARCTRTVLSFREPFSMDGCMHRVWADDLLVVAYAHYPSSDRIRLSVVRTDCLRNTEGRRGGSLQTPGSRSPSPRRGLGSLRPSPSYEHGGCGRRRARFPPYVVRSSR